jgi:hypothetical protein
MPTITLSEAIAVLKQRQNKFHRLLNRMERQVKQYFDPSVTPEKQDEYNALKEQFIQDAVQRFEEAEAEAKQVMTELRELKTVINKANVDRDQVKRLTEHRFIKERLKNCMNMLGEGRYTRGSNSDIVDAIDVQARIDELEKEKNKLDKHIQHTNHQTEVSISFTP